MSRTAATSRRYAAIGAASVLALTLAACSQTPVAPAGDDGNGPATLWVRAADAPLDEKMVEAWNAANPEREIELVAIPDAQYVQKFVQAVQSGDVPDIAVVDIANAQALVTEGLLADITDKVNELDYRDELAPAAIDISSVDGVIYGVPHQLDLSLLYYNKELFAQAGLDPEAPPSNYQEILEASRAISALGPDHYGFYLAGNCAGCNAYTTLPYVWANGGDVLAEGGMTASLDDPAVATTFDFIKQLWDEELIPPSAKDDNGATWVTSFQSNTIGMVSLGSFGIGLFGADGPDFGVAPIPGENGGSAAFVGGDVVGIPVNAKNAGTAWDFIEWSMSEEVQTDIVAAAGSLVVRSDVIDNPNTSADPRRVTANELIATAQVPDTPKYNSVFIDATGPFLQLIRNWVFDGQGAGAIASTQSSFDERLRG